MIMKNPYYFFNKDDRHMLVLASQDGYGGNIMKQIKAMCPLESKMIKEELEKDNSIGRVFVVKSFVIAIIRRTFRTRVETDALPQIVSKLKDLGLKYKTTIEDVRAIREFSQYELDVVYYEDSEFKSAATFGVSVDEPNRFMLPHQVRAKLIDKIDIGEYWLNQD